VSGSNNLRGKPRIPNHLLADKEKRSRDALPGKRAKHSRRTVPVRPIVKRERDTTVSKSIDYPKRTA
jgi:hypothetical protein